MSFKYPGEKVRYLTVPCLIVTIQQKREAINLEKKLKEWKFQLGGHWPSPHTQEDQMFSYTFLSLYLNNIGSGQWL